MPENQERLLLRVQQSFQEFLERQEEVRRFFEENLVNQDQMYNVLLKIRAIDNLYGTNTHNKNDLAERISHIHDIDDRLREGDITLIHDIADLMHNNGQEITDEQFTFASRFCTLHQPELFPLYDALMAKTIVIIRKEHIIDSSISLSVIKHNPQELTVIYNALKEILAMPLLTNIQLYNVIAYLSLQTILRVVNPDTLTDVVTNGGNILLKILVRMVSSGIGGITPIIIDPIADILIDRLMEELRPYYQQMFERLLNNRNRSNRNG